MVSGVIVAYFHNFQLSSNIPVWVCNIIKCCQNKKRHEISADDLQISSKYVGAIEISSDQDLGNNTETKSSTVKNEAVGVNKEDTCLITWKDLGLLIDRFLLLICVCTTVISMIVILVCFLVFDWSLILHFDGEKAELLLVCIKYCEFVYTKLR